ncbi:MAG: serine--tRNA ligase, partial [Allorhizobium sp.]
MLDIKWIRDNPEALDAALAKRGAEPLSASLIALDQKRRAVAQSMQDMQSRRNSASKEIGAAMASKDMELAEKLKAEVASLKDTLPAAEEEERQLTAELTDALHGLADAGGGFGVHHRQDGGLVGDQRGLEFRQTEGFAPGA